jgi:hypothetical protein
MADEVKQNDPQLLASGQMLVATQRDTWPQHPGFTLCPEGCGESYPKGDSHICWPGTHIHLHHHHHHHYHGPTPRGAQGG